MKLKLSDNTFHAAFGAVITRYQERLCTNGTLEAMGYAHGVATGWVSYASCTAIVRPSNSDLICDVELNARRILTPRQLEYFNTYYKSATLPIADAADIREHGHDMFFAEHLERFPESKRASIILLDNEVREKLGRRFMDVKIYELETYMSPVDIRGRKLRTGKLRQPPVFATIKMEYKNPAPKTGTILPMLQACAERFFGVAA